MRIEALSMGEATSEAARSAIAPMQQVTAPTVRLRGDAASPDVEELVAEEPLELRVRGADEGEAATESLAVIMRTPGHDDELAAGFLFTEGLLADRDELASLLPGSDPDGLPSPHVIEVVPAADVDLLGRARAEGYSRRFVVNTSCGVCGKNSVAAACAALAPISRGGLVVAPSLLYGLPDRLRAEQRVFAHTGGLHAAALFDARGALVALREDVGRHNAVDKLVGRALLDGTLPLDEHVLLVSGRLSYEIVLKALAARIPLVAAISAPSSLAVELADASGITLVAFLRGTGANVYTHPWRIVAAG
jgi:FdhD protein